MSLISSNYFVFQAAMWYTPTTDKDKKAFEDARNDLKNFLVISKDPIQVGKAQRK